MTLRTLAEQTSVARGLLHQASLRTLRTYVKQHTDEELEREIRSIDNAITLRTLWEAGLNQRLQDALIAKLQELI